MFQTLYCTIWIFNFRNSPHKVKQLKSCKIFCCFADEKNALITVERAYVLIYHMGLACISHVYEASNDLACNLGKKNLQPGPACLAQLIWQVGAYKVIIRIK